MYPTCNGHYSVDSEVDLSPAQTISRKLTQHRGILLTGHWIEIDDGTPWYDPPDPHGGLADSQPAADPGVLDVRRGVAGCDQEGGSEPFALDLSTSRPRRCASRLIEEVVTTVTEAP